MIYIFDFGSQFCHLIGRRLSDMGVDHRVIDPSDALKEIRNQKPSGIIFSGGPSSVYGEGAPTIDKKVFTLGIPIFGICYGCQIAAHLLGGKVIAGHKEYGPAKLSVFEKSPILEGIDDTSFTVWMSHGDEVVEIPPSFKTIASTDTVGAGVFVDEKAKIYCVQFHPEVEHTIHGSTILRNFAHMCGETIGERVFDVAQMIADVKKTVGTGKVIMAFSGGTDSFVAGALIAKAIGDRLIPVYIESGLMRPDALTNVTEVFPELFGFAPRVIHAEALFLERLKGVKDPEEKRKKIGKLYVELFEKEAVKIPGITYLAQGTTYADMIHSKGTKNAALIKSHHNVGGLPEHMKLKLLEPIKYYYTDQVRMIGKLLDLPDAVVYQQPFPGPGFAVRVLGEVTPERLAMVKGADAIVLDVIASHKLKDQIFQYFAIATGTKSTGVRGDGRFYGEVIAIRAYTTKDRMTADWAKIPYEVLGEISTRIVNEVPGASRVVYDITTKPPATMEWE